MFVVPLVLGANLADEPPLRAVELAVGVEGQLVVDVGHPGLADLGNKVTLCHGCLFTFFILVSLL